MSNKFLFIQKINFFLNYLLQFYKLKIIKDPFAITANQWFKDNGDSNLRLDYPLNKNSVVFDVGGYMGEWSENIVNLYNPHMYIFEPVPIYYSKILHKLNSDSKISVYNFGLSDKNQSAKIALINDASSVYKNNNAQINIYLKDIYDFLKENDISKIDLIKINIEGGEYTLLKRMIDKKIIERCSDIQVQFHDFINDAEEIREEIRNSLSKTHFLTYDYPFVWENWQKK